MRIGIISSGTITDRIPPVYGGGIQKYLWNLGRELSRLGHKVHLFTYRQPNQSNEEMLEGVYVHRISRILRTKIFATIIFGFKTFLKILKIQKARGAFHILHAQSRVSGLIVRSFLRNVPFVFTVHNWDVALSAPGFILSFFPYAILRFIEKRVYSQSNKLIALTEHFQRILIKCYGISATKIHIISNMVNTQEKTKSTIPVHPQIEKIASKPFLLFIGRLEKEKGCEYLLQTFKFITDQNATLRLVIVGGGSLEDKLKRMSIELNLGNKIYILGNIHEIQLTHLLRKARALILPSQFEIMPTVILEAWAAGCPVIVNNFYGVKALIHHKKTGLLFQNDQPDQLPLFVHELLKKQELRQNLIKNSKIQVNTKYASSRVVKQIFNLYNDLLTRCNK